jgi:hypothetical protein
VTAATPSGAAVSSLTRSDVELTSRDIGLAIRFGTVELEEYIADRTDRTVSGTSEALAAGTTQAFASPGAHVTAVLLRYGILPVRNLADKEHHAAV